jgi:hypothetical protein
MVVFGGELKMSDFIWTWTKGNTKVFTMDTDSAEKAMKEGNLVMGVRAPPNVIKI